MHLEGYVNGIAWLPDGSGFVYAEVRVGEQSANLYRYDMASGQATALTSFEGGYGEDSPW